MKRVRADLVTEILYHHWLRGKTLKIPEMNWRYGLSFFYVYVLKKGNESMSKLISKNVRLVQCYLVTIFAMVNFNL